MMVAFFTPLNLLILMVAQNCLTITNCADSGHKRDKDVYEKLSTPRLRKLRNVGKATSTSGAVAGAGSLTRQQYNWTSELDRDILANYYSNIRNDIIDWNTVYTFLSARHPNIPPSAATYDRVQKLIKKLVSTTPPFGEGNVLWDPYMMVDVVRIYYRTRGGDKIEHALNMYKEWRNEHRHNPNFSPIDLLRQAENMLIRLDLLDAHSSISEAPNESGKETDFLNQSRKEKHHQYYEFMGVQDNPLVHSQSAYDHAQGIGVSSSHQGSTHEHPDLDLSLVPSAVGTPRFHDSDVDLDLSLSSRKKKGKSIWKRGSS